jgi:hypothetical protein
LLKFLGIGSVALFSVVGVVALTKKGVKSADPVIKTQEKASVSASVLPPPRAIAAAQAPIPSIDRVFQLFTTGPSKLPIVETVEYSSSTPWLKGRPAWLSDYAAYYGTSKHFIARSLTNSLDYFAQKVFPGNRFNVFKRDKKIEFHLVVDVSCLQMAFYYLDLDTHERVLLKVYSVGLGRVNPNKPSHIETPLGTYQLGDKVAVYKPGVIGFFHDKKTEMIQVFGSRWIPFGEEIEGCSEPAKGYGLHGAPWRADHATGNLIEVKDGIGKYDTDGSIELVAKDIEELYAIIVTKPTFIHIGKSFQEITLPGVEVATPSR